MTKMRFFLMFLVIMLVLGYESPAYAQGCWNYYENGGTCICLAGKSAGYLSCQNGTPMCQTGASCGLAGGCFVAGTGVDTAYGPMPIEVLRPGDFVVSSYDTNGRPICSEVVRTYRVIQDEYVEINRSIRVTKSHPFKVGRKWKPAGELRIGDELIGESGQAISVVTLQTVQKGVRAYNIEVAEQHTFFANGILVHNKIIGKDP